MKNNNGKGKLRKIRAMMTFFAFSSIRKDKIYPVAQNTGDAASNNMPIQVQNSADKTIKTFLVLKGFCILYV